MIHRVDADYCIEAVIVEGKPRVRIRNAEPHSVMLLGPDGHFGCRGHAGCVRINSGNSTTDGARKIESWPTGAACDLEDVIVGRQPEPGEKAIVLFYRQPAVLTDVYAERFPTDTRERIFGKMRVRTIQIGLGWHLAIDRKKRLIVKNV